MKRKNIAIIGDGMVGSTIAYSLFLQGLAENITLVDTDLKKPSADALDMNHAAHLVGKGAVKAGTYSDIKDCDIVIITASVPGRYIKSRDELVLGNADLFKSLCEQLKPNLKDDSFIIVVSNPVDTMAYLTATLLEIDPMRVIGSGTLLDSSRLCYNIAFELGCSPKDVEALVVGEHGEREAVLLSSVKVNEKPLAEVLAEKNLTLDEDHIISETIDDGNIVQAGKGYTNFAIASAVSAIVKALSQHTGTNLPVSTYIAVDNVFLSLPVTLNDKGICDISVPELTPKEQQAFDNSLRAIKRTIFKALTHIDNQNQEQNA